MALYRHPHLTRGVVHTPMGAFTVNRGLVDLPDSMGESLGWEPVTSETTWSAPAEPRRDWRSAALATPTAHPPASR